VSIWCVGVLVTKLCNCNLMIIIPKIAVFDVYAGVFRPKIGLIGKTRLSLGNLYWNIFGKRFSLTQTTFIKASIQSMGENAMLRKLKIGIIGDYEPDLRSHMATDEALAHAASALAVSLRPAWIPTQSLDGESVGKILKPFHALWCAPASPYKSMDGALEAIKFAREQGWPFIGT
jgi:CTP synthase (UTP-ammonia lyase)